MTKKAEGIVKRSQRESHNDKGPKAKMKDFS